MDEKLVVDSNPRILLLDIENCPDQLSWLGDELPAFERIIACHGPVEPKLPLSLVKELATAIHAGQLEFVGMARGGKNAADFGLAFLAGKLAAELPLETEFYILSKDTDLDHVVDMLQQLPRKAKRITGRILPAAAKGSDESGMSAAEEFWEHQLRGQRDRPVRRESLLNAIRNYFRTRRTVNSEAVLRGLLESGAVAEDVHGRLTYPLCPKKKSSRKKPAPECLPADLDDEPIPF